MPTYYIDKLDFQIVSKTEIEPYILNAPDAEYSVFIQIAYLTGMRLSEIMALNKEKDFQLQQFSNRDGTIETAYMISHKALKHGTRGYAMFSLNDPFVSEIKAYVDALPDGSDLFHRKCRSTYEKMMLHLNRELHNADTSKYITFHYLRHSRISYLARVLHAYPDELKSWTGHTSQAYEIYFAPQKVERFAGNIK